MTVRRLKQKWIDDLQSGSFSPSLIELSESYELKNGMLKLTVDEKFELPELQNLAILVHAHKVVVFPGEDYGDGDVDPTEIVLYLDPEFLQAMCETPKEKAARTRAEEKARDERVIDNLRRQASALGLGLVPQIAMSKEEKELYLTCEDCGVAGPEVEDTTCPYAEEISGEEVEVCLCPRCYEQRGLDV